MKLTAGDLQYLASCLEGLFFGLYSGIFAMLLQYHGYKKLGTDNARQNITLYALCVLYVLSAVVVAIDTAKALPDSNLTASYGLGICETAVFACCDFITQTILIHRCWIVWGCNIRIIIIPSILAFAFLVMWISIIGSQFIAPGGISAETLWGADLVLTGLTASMTVNALVTGLIVFRIFKVFRREVKSITTSNEKHSDLSGGRKVRSIIFIIIESGVALFAIQFTRLATTVIITVTSTETGGILVSVFSIIISIHEMLNGITPTLTLLRVSMGLSFHDETSFLGAVNASFQSSIDDQNSIPMDNHVDNLNARGSLQVRPDDPITIPEMPNSIGQERRDNDMGESHGIQMVDR